MRPTHNLKPDVDSHGFYLDRAKGLLNSATLENHKGRSKEPVSSRTCNLKGQKAERERERHDAIYFVMVQGGQTHNTGEKLCVRNPQVGGLRMGSMDVFVHLMGNAPHPVRSAKLSPIQLNQYLILFLLLAASVALASVSLPNTHPPEKPQKCQTQQRLSLASSGHNMHYIHYLYREQHFFSSTFFFTSPS
jgi:hypothetical protein